MRILIAEDEQPLAAALRDALASQGHAVDVAFDGELALDQALHGPYDLVVLDISLPRRTGLEICRVMRAAGRDLPILMLTARDSLADKVTGLDAGADDYLIKPFELDELHARVRALLRRRTPMRDPVLRVGPLTLDPATGRATRDGRELTLPRKELALLEYFMRNPGRLLTREQILDHVWDGDASHESDIVRAHVKLLRRAIADQGTPRLIQTVHGVGFRLVAPDGGPAC